jgi:hypothetical protein
MHLEGFLDLNSVVEEMLEEKRKKLKNKEKKKRIRRKGKDGVMHSVWERSDW